MNNRLATFLLPTILIFAACPGAAAAPQDDRQMEALLQSARIKEFVDGDLRGAIEIYKKAAVGANRAAAATAVVEMRRLYQRLSSGNPDAMKEYERFLVKNQVPVDPVLFPNRNRGVFVAGMDPNSGRVHGSAVRLTQYLLPLETAPSWSPDGRFIAFLRQWQGAPAEVIVRNTGTGEEGIYTAVPGPRPLQWFHDSQGLMKGRDNTWLNRLDLKGGGYVDIVRADHNDIGQVAISPDDRTVYVATRNPNNNSIGVFDILTGKEREGQRIVLPVADSRIRKVALSPDGRTFAILEGQNNRWRVSRVGVDGRGYFTVYAASPIESLSDNLMWTRDGKVLLVGRKDDHVIDDKWQIVRIAADGTDRPLSIGLEVKSLNFFDLSPDGTRIVFDGAEPTIAVTNP